MEGGNFTGSDVRDKNVKRSGIKGMNASMSSIGVVNISLIITKNANYEQLIEMLIPGVFIIGLEDDR